MHLPFLPFAFLDVGTPELMLIFFAILILFGGQRLPELAKGLGKSIREFKKASAGVEEEIKRAIESAPEPSAKPQTVLPRAEPVVAPATPVTPSTTVLAAPTPTPAADSSAHPAP